MGKIDEYRKRKLIVDEFFNKYFPIVNRVKTRKIVSKYSRIRFLRLKTGFKMYKNLYFKYIDSILEEYENDELDYKDIITLEEDMFGSMDTYKTNFLEAGVIETNSIYDMIQYCFKYKDYIYSFEVKEKDLAKLYKIMDRVLSTGDYKIEDYINIKIFYNTLELAKPEQAV